MNLLTHMADQAWLPDPVIRFGIRRVIGMRLTEEQRRSQQERSDFIDSMRRSPLALSTDVANDQHYEVPAAFFGNVLGPHLKYSCALWKEGVTDLDRAEADMLALTARRADLTDGQQILELGCGWGSLTLFMAATYPNSRITAVSNSASQAQFIEDRCRQRNITNVRVITADMNHFSIDQHFDRVVSVEMFEHMRNWAVLLERIDRWLTDDGQLFVHIFSHRNFAYPYETGGSSNWMGRHFFTGGIMPADDLIFRFQDHLKVKRHWRLNGSHYHRTAEAWLANMDANREKLLPILAETYGEDQARIWFQRWRIFFMACSELWATDGGEQWIVSHYRLQRNAG